MTSLIHRCIVLGAMLCVLGCGGGEKVEYPETVPVTGKITLDGKPLEGAQLTIRPESTGEKSYPARASSEADGSFQAFTFFSAASDVPGVVPGKYKVSVVKMDTPAGTGAHDAAGGGGGEAPVDPTNRAAMQAQASTGPGNILPSKYGSPTTSGLEFEVKAGENKTLVFELESE